MWSLCPHAAPVHEQRPAERGETPKADGKRQKAPQQTEGCALETRGGLLLETPFGIYATEPVVATIHGVHAGGYSRKRRRVAEEATNARERGARTRETTLSRS
jgi:hypothetical protein